MKGYTLLSEGKPSVVFEAAKSWLKIPVEIVDIESGSCQAWIPNEYINWQHFRATDELKPVWTELIRKLQGLPSSQIDLRRIAVTPLNQSEHKS